MCPPSSIIGSLQPTFHFALSVAAVGPEGAGGVASAAQGALRRRGGAMDLAMEE